MEDECRAATLTLPVLLPGGPAHPAPVGPAAGQHVLLVTDRPFMDPVDGASQIYRTWLLVLRELGCQVSVLSFNRRSARWSARDRARLAEMDVGSLIVDAFGGLGGVVLNEAVSLAWRLVGGRRYLPRPVECLLRRSQHDRLAAFLCDGQFDAMVMIKLHTTALIGRRLLREVRGRKILDLLDNYPMRERLNRQVLLDFARTDPGVLRTSFKPREMLHAIGWGGQRRMLREEVAEFADFDHVVFNAAEEAADYRRAGLPPAKVARLAWPFLSARDAARDVASGERPYQLGLIGSAALSNCEGVRFLVRQVLPLLRPYGVRLLVAGTIGRVARMFMEPQDGDVLGWIDDVRTFYDQVEVVAVPLLTGTGISVKAVEAAACGSAMVATRVGLRGLDLEPGREVLVADDAQGFAASILRILDDPALRAELRRNAAQAVRRRHSREAFAAGVGRLLLGPVMPQADASGGASWLRSQGF